MKLNWIAKSTAVVAVLYPASLIIARHSNGVTDSVLVFAILVLVTLLIVVLVEHARLNAPLGNQLLILGVSMALFGNLFLNELINKPGKPLTIFAGIAFSMQLLAVIVTAWRNGNKNKPNANRL